jgi:hypothetical protein
MPGKRHDSQTVTTLSLNKDLLSLVEQARLKMPGNINRAEFIRMALSEKLTRMGVDVSEDITRAPDRARLIEAVKVETKKTRKK